NPNNGIFTINFENKFAKNDRIEIYNVLGKMVNSTILNSNTTQINMKDDAAGIYMYKVLSENGSMISNGKIIVK
ncbi:MAG TPA: T9SS type A sorting domain-containing protein, partial [Bacteroidia bacterium]|nr:T9SS type A sorting domain-containing protein [Bacteroidia bacterium]